MASYMGKLAGGSQFYVRNQGDQTQITIQTSSAGQQQSQSSGLTTGAWTAPPTLFQLANQFILRLEGAQGKFYVQLSMGGIQTTSKEPSLLGAQVLPLRVVEPADPAGFQSMGTMKPLSPMKPMEPMKPMSPMPPMRMEMGDMRMEMGGADTPTEPGQGQAQARPRFCSQCGTPVNPDDRFCAQCGHKLAGA